MSTDLNDLLCKAIARAEAKGATSADAVAVEELEGHVRVRLGEIEQIQRARQRRLGIRVFCGQSQAISASGDLREATLERLVDDTVAMARLTAEDPFAGLPDPRDCGAVHVERPDLHDPAADVFDLEKGVAWAREAERVAMAADPRITNSEGAEFGFSSVLRAFAASGGVTGSYRSSHFSGYVVPVAVHEGAMERDYWYTQRRHYRDVESPEFIGRIAAERTLRRLGSAKGKTCEVPIVFDERTASSIVGAIAGAVNGGSIYRGASFLKGKLGERIASELVTIVDDGVLPGGMGTRPYDGEGSATRTNVVVENGILRTYLLDTYSGRKLSSHTTGNAVRAVSDAPGVGATNFHLRPGSTPEAELLSGIAQGFYVTDLIGFGVNGTTGDYSQGAAGLWIVDGKLAHAVSEVTIAGNLLAMLQDVEGVGDHIDVHRGVSSPALRLRKMMVAGA